MPGFVYKGEWGGDGGAGGGARARAHLARARRERRRQLCRSGHLPVAFLRRNQQSLGGLVPAPYPRRFRGPAVDRAQRLAHRAVAEREGVSVPAELMDELEAYAAGRL